MGHNKLKLAACYTLLSYLVYFYSFRLCFCMLGSFPLLSSVAGDSTGGTSSRYHFIFWFLAPLPVYLQKELGCNWRIYALLGGPPRNNLTFQSFWFLKASLIFALTRKNVFATGETNWCVGLSLLDACLILRDLTHNIQAPGGFCRSPPPT